MDLERNFFLSVYTSLVDNFANRSWQCVNNNQNLPSRTEAFDSSRKILGKFIIRSRSNKFAIRARTPSSYAIVFISLQWNFAIKRLQQHTYIFGLIIPNEFYDTRIKKATLHDRLAGRKRTSWLNCQFSSLFYAIIIEIQGVERRESIGQATTFRRLRDAVHVPELDPGSSVTSIFRTVYIYIYIYTGTQSL